jgi:hypothetical protein
MDHASSIMVGPTAKHTHAPHTLRHWPGRAVRLPSLATRRGPAGRARWRACATIAPPRQSSRPSSLAFAQGTTQSPPLRPPSPSDGVAGAPHLPLPLLEYKHAPSLHSHPVSAPVHAHCPSDPPAHRNRRRRDGPAPFSPPATTGLVSGQIDDTNRSRVSPIPPLAAWTPESGLLPPPASPCRRQGPHCRA